MKKIIVSTLTVLLLVLVLATATLAAPSAGHRALLLKGSLQATETQQGARRHEHRHHGQGQPCREIPHRAPWAGAVVRGSGTLDGAGY